MNGLSYSSVTKCNLSAEKTQNWLNILSRYAYITCKHFINIYDSNLC